MPPDAAPNEDPAGPEPSDHDARTPAAGDPGDDASAAPLRPEDVRDELPEDLDAVGFVGPYQFPDNSRRRVPGIIYLVVAAACVAAWALTRGDDPVLVNTGFLWAAAGLGLMGVYSISAGWHLGVDEQEALVAANRAVGFAVGHASAQMAWRGLRSRPIWRVLVYSSEEPPAQRGLVVVDAVDGTIVEQLVEDNPEPAESSPS